MIKRILRKLVNVIKLVIFKMNWRKRNKHNFTTANNIFPADKVTIGQKTYGSLNVISFGNSNEKLVIGSYCSIANDVKFLLGGEHPYKGLSTYPFRKYICGLNENTPTKGPIVIKDDVWIGYRCLILSGITIGQGSIIAAGSVVAKDIPPYAIFAGDKIIKYRFSEDIIRKLKKFNYTKLKEDMIKNNIDLLYTDLDIKMLDNDFFEAHFDSRRKVDE